MAVPEDTPGMGLDVSATDFQTEKTSGSPL